MKRPAFTLLELLLVLALISAISGLGIAGYQRQHERAKFKSGVVGVQIDLNRTRLLAMRSGQPYMFRFIPGTGIYEIAPLQTLQEAIYRMNGDSTNDLMDPLGGTLSSGGLASSTDAYATSGGYGADPYGASSGELPSDNLFSYENIQADLEQAGRLQPTAGAMANASGLGGALVGSSYGVAGYGASTGDTALAGATATSGTVDPFASISSDGLGTGGQFALGTDTSLANLAVQNGITIREMNSEERPLGATENTIAWRVNLDGLVVRKEAQGDVVFSFSRLSDSTPTNLKQRRPGGVKDSQDAQGAFADSQGEDLGSRLGGSLLSVPTAGDSEGLGGGLTAQTSGVETYENALTNYEDQNGPLSLWSDPILFYPNGRTSTAVVALANFGKYSYYSEIGLRGMTGYARISSITSAPSGMNPGESVLTQEQLFRMTNPGVAVSGGAADPTLTGGALNSSAPGAATATQGALGGAATVDSSSIPDLSAETIGLSTTAETQGQGATVNYGSTTRRSGYSFAPGANAGATTALPATATTEIDAGGGLSGAAVPATGALGGTDALTTGAAGGAAPAAGNAQGALGGGTSGDEQDRANGAAGGGR